MTLMKALIKPSPNPGLSLADVERPQIGPHDVLIHVKKNGALRYRLTYL